MVLDTNLHRVKFISHTNQNYLSQKSKEKENLFSSSIIFSLNTLYHVFGRQISKKKIICVLILSFGKFKIHSFSSNISK